jgi:lambda family phage minor tail protein L
MNTISAIMLATPLEGAKVTRIRTLARYLDAANFAGGVNPYGTPDSTAEFPREVFLIDRVASETSTVVEFELAAAFDLAGIRIPKRQCLSSICGWVFKSTECGYVGGIATCEKTIDACRYRFNNGQLPFGGFPGVGNFYS